MKIAFQYSETGFSKRWIDYCLSKKIDFVIVDPYHTNIVEQLKNADIFFWHHHHSNFKDVLIAKKLLFALEHSGVHVFPDFRTSWHFDDKVAQKYLFEATRTPSVPSYVFYSQAEAYRWLQKVEFPIVWKLRGGAGSANVKLVKSRLSAMILVFRAFNLGFPQFNRFSYFRERLYRFIAKKDSIYGLLKALARLFIPTSFSWISGREIGYIYFQKFLPNNKFDIRVIVIGQRAFAVKRMVRYKDFRASGSGNPIYNPSDIDIRCIEMSFKINSEIRSQSLALDFVFDEKNNPLVIEVSYGFAVNFYDPCPGYWNNNLIWHPGFFKPQDWMIEEALKFHHARGCRE